MSGSSACAQLLLGYPACQHAILREFSPSGLSRSLICPASFCNRPVITGLQDDHCRIPDMVFSSLRSAGLYRLYLSTYLATPSGRIPGPSESAESDHSWVWYSNLGMLMWDLRDIQSKSHADVILQRRYWREGSTYDPVVGLVALKSLPARPLIPPSYILSSNIFPSGPSGPRGLTMPKNSVPQWRLSQVLINLAIHCPR